MPDFLFSADRRLPTFARAFVTEKENCRIVHLLNYQPDLRGLNLMIEDALPLDGVRGSLRLDGRKVKNVYLAPEKETVPYTIEDDRLNFTVPEAGGYAMIVAELED